MKNVKINLTDGDFLGSITMSSASKVSAVRIAKSEVSNYYNELDEAGVYLLLIGTDDVYVGESGLDTVGNRIMKPHSGSIDSLWHTVVAFVISDPMLGKNELLYMENAMCEYVYNHFGKCLTVTPSQKTCNAAFRKSHYKLGAIQISTCDAYLSDMEDYINLFPKGLFYATGTAAAMPPTPAPSPVRIDILHLSSKKISATGYVVSDGFVVCKGSDFCAGESASCPKSTKAQRARLIAYQKAINGKFTQDVKFGSPSAAASCILGVSTNGNKAWLHSDGSPLK